MPSMVVTRPSVRSTGLPRAVRAFPAASANMAAAVTAVACSSMPGTAGRSPEGIAEWGAHVMTISVIAGNEGALRFYRREGASDYLHTLIMPVRQPLSLCQCARGSGRMIPSGKSASGKLTCTFETWWLVAETSRSWLVSQSATAADERMISVS